MIIAKSHEVRLLSSVEVRQEKEFLSLYWILSSYNQCNTLWWNKGNMSSASVWWRLINVFAYYQDIAILAFFDLNKVINHPSSDIQFTL